MNNKLTTLALMTTLALGPTSGALAEDVQVAQNTYSQEVVALLAEAEKYGVKCTGDMNRGPRQDICRTKIDGAKYGEQTKKNIREARRIVNGG